MAKVESWPPYQVSRLRDALEDLAETVVKINDPEVAPWLSRMLVVRSSGYVEQASREIFRAFIEARSGGLVRSFGQSWLEKSRNPSPESLLEMIGRFDSSIRDELDRMLEGDDQRLRRELSFLVDRRNQIAHGLNEGINRDKSVALKDVAIEVVDWLILRFNPLRI